MKPENIYMALDLAVKARENKEVFNPLFVGEAGLGKSAIVQAWVKNKQKVDPNYGFIDLRIALMEAPDLIGYPECAEDKNGLMRTCHRLPEFWPTSGSGLLLLEEPNRGTTGVMNCLMQILTDRKVHNYTMPEGWIIAGCINDGSEYDVNTMDAALKDRFEHFEVEFSPISFLDYIERSNWHSNVQLFLRSGLWTYKMAKEIGGEGKYISPRTWSKMNAAENANVSKDRNAHNIVARSVLGDGIGKEYHKFCFDAAPVTANDILKDKEAAFSKLKTQSAGMYNGDMITATIDSIVQNYGGLKKECNDKQIDEETMAEVAEIIPADLAVVLVKECGYKQSKGQINTFFDAFTKKYPKLIARLKDNIKLTKATAGSKQAKTKQEA